MLNRNEYMPFEFEPMDGNYNRREPAPRKRHTALKIAALALVCAIVGGVGGGVLTAALMSRAGAEPAVAADEILPAAGEAEVERPEHTEEENVETPAELPIDQVIHTNTSGTVLTPKELYNQNVNAVVGINVTGTLTGTNVWGYATPFASSGSGFIITEDGYIVTNAHVVSNAETVKVSLYNGTTYDARIIGTYPENDVALLKVDATGLLAAGVGDSDKIAVGDEVVAIGNPLGQLTFTMTVGYVSALDRSINANGNPINMFQTDAAINSGNSGGPLFDMQGNVVGITTAKPASNAFSSGATVEGIGFAIPINDAMRIVNDLKEFGHVTGQPYLGVTINRRAQMDSSTAAYYNLPLGALVETVNPGSCAEKAGVKTGDIITALGEAKVESYNELTAALKTHRAGDKITLTVFRSGETKTLNVTLDEKPADPEPTEEQQQPQQQQQQQASPYGSGDAYRFNPFDFFGFF